MNQVTCCPYCAYPIKTESVTLWDGRDYCRACVESVSPELYALAREGAPLQDVLYEGDVNFGMLYKWMAKLFVPAVSVIFILPLFIAFAVVKGEVITFLAGVGIIFAMAAVVLALGSAYDLHVIRSKSPRTVEVREGRIFLTLPEASFEFELRDCSWQSGAKFCDKSGMLIPLPQGITICTPKFPFTCGFHPKTAERWRDFLTLARMKRTPKLGCLNL